jgi:4-diphosphocytidyl-2-C-methyl-D-erythritol kinase
MVPPARLGRRAPAKLNLYLHLTGRRADGYHLIDSLFAFADVGDEIEVAADPTLSLVVDGPFAAAIDGAADDNLVLRAARALAAVVQAREGIAPGARICLVKNLPVAAGIGGGSADAAAVLLALVDLWSVDIAEADLRALALGLGADVPACLAGAPVAVSGIGEVLQPAVALPPVFAVLANPNVPLATAPVFKAFAAAGSPFSPPAPLLTAPGDAAALAAAMALRGNDLEAPARTLVPEVGQVLAALGSLPGALLARMSGSGATCFALFASAAEAKSSATTLARLHPGWWVRAAPLL